MQTNWSSIPRELNTFSRFRSIVLFARQFSSRMLKLGRISWQVLCWVFVLSVSALAEPPTITLATLNWEPYVSEEIANGGFTTEIVRQAFQRAGYRIEITYMPWARVLSEVKNGVFDAMYPAYYSESRGRVYALSESIADGPLVLCKRSDRPMQYRSLEDLKPYSIGVVRGYVNTAEFDDAHYLDKRIVNSDKQNLLKVLTGRIDLAIIDMFTAQQIIETSIPQAKGKLDFLKPPLEIKPLYVGFSKKRGGYREHLNAFNRALNEMKNEGIIQKIYTSHGFRVHTSP
jgi:polar amino acid transport system substrate-binding protein